MSTDDVSLDGRTLSAVATDGGEVGADTSFEQDGDRIAAEYAGGGVFEGHLLGTLRVDTWDVRYVQVDGETATGHSVGEVSVRDGGRVRVEDESESEPGTATSVREGVR